MKTISQLIIEQNDRDYGKPKKTFAPIIDKKSNKQMFRDFLKNKK